MQYIKKALVACHIFECRINDKYVNIIKYYFCLHSVHGQQYLLLLFALEHFRALVKSQKTAQNRQKFVDIFQ